MSSQNWIEISINTTSEVSDILSEFLTFRGSDAIVVDKDDNDEIVSYLITLKSYFTEDFKDIDSLVEELKNKLNEFSQSGLNIGNGNVTVKIIKEEDWSNWQQYFEPFKTGNHLVFKPIWSEYEKQDGDIVIDFDPGGFFGATPHPSTKLCLEEIEEICLNTTNKDECKILDLGSGSGILSLAFYHMGLKKITAIDIDEIAVSTSEANFKLSNMDIPLFLGEIKDCNEIYDIIAGNLLPEIIEVLAEDISNKLNKGGIFIGAGITKEQEPKVIEILEKVGIKSEAKRTFEEWVLLKGIKQ
ncbi:MAG: 50S ribosomal protein L11 methyltransferase [Candidatus Sericytochromatia bacterium]